MVVLVLRWRVPRRKGCAERTDSEHVVSLISLSAKGDIIFWNELLRNYAMKKELGGLSISISLS